MRDSDLWGRVVIFGGGGRSVMMGWSVLVYFLVVFFNS